MQVDELQQKQLHAPCGQHPPFEGEGREPSSLVQQEWIFVSELSTAISS